MTMRSCKFGLSVFICLLAVVSTSLGSSFPTVFAASQVLAQTNTERKAEADRLLNEGFDYRRFGKVELALKSHGQALQIYREIKDRRGEALALSAFGDVYINLGNYPKGIEYFQQSLAIARSIKKPDIEFWILSYLGDAYSGLGNYPQAIKYAEQSLIISRQLKDKQKEGNALQDLGTVYRKLGDYQKAIDYVEQGLKIAREVKNDLEQGSALKELGEIYWYEGDYAKAIEYFQQGLKIFRDIKRPYAELSALNGLGRAYWKQGNYSQAVEYLTQGLRISREFKDRRGEGADLLTLGNVYSEQENYPKAIDYLQQSLLIAEETNDLSRKGKILNNLGHIFYKQGNLALAERTLIESLKVKESLRDSKLGDNQKVSLYDTQRNTYNTLQKVLIAQNKTDAALEIAERSRSRAFVELLSSRLTANANDDLKSPQPLEKQKSQKHTKLQNTTFVQNSIYSASNLPVASQIFAQTNNDHKAEADRLFNQGIQQFQTSQLTAALQLWEQALQIYREIKDRQSEGKALGNLGNAYYFIGNYPKAIDYYQQSLAIAKEIKDRKSEGQSLGNLGLAYYSIGNYPKAIEYHEQSLGIAKEIKYRQGEGQSLGNLGLAYDSLGNYPKAIEYHEQSLVIAKEIKNRRGESAAMGNLGSAYFSLGEYQKAIDYHQQSLVIAREIKDRKGEGGELSSLGNAYVSLRDYQTAIDFYQQSLVIAREIKNRKGEGQVLGNLGIVYQNLRNYPKAIEYHQQRLVIAREIGDPEGESNALGNLGVVYYSLENYPKAIEYSQQFLSKAREIKYLLGEGIALNNLGFALYKSGDIVAAEKTLYEGIKVYESLRNTKLNDTSKVSIFETQRSVYNTLQQVLIAQNKTDRALEIAERGRGRAFAELLGSQVSSNPQEQLSNPPNIEQIKQTAKAQNATLVQYSIITDDFKVAGRQKTEESELYIWVIKPTGKVTFRKADLKPLWQKENINLSSLVTTSRQSIGVRSRGIQVSYQPNLSKAQNNLKRLHEILINPIADLLPKKETDKVIFIPQNSLFLVPFPALQDKKGKYLIEKHTILTSPSIQVLDLTHQKRQNIEQRNFTSPLIVGNPTMPQVAFKIGDKPQQLTSLPGAEKEAKAIASLFNTQALIGNNATEAAIVQRLPQARIIHFATHGLFDDIRGLDSAIALAPSPGRLALTPENPNSLSSPLSKEDKNYDGLLTAEEILDLKINADLVVLSACDTGRGRITGDGVIGLSRSLISAGTPSVIVSLWAVDDGSTAFLMTEFYQNLQQKLDKATALRNAMLTAKKKYASPSQWAAFTLIGESE